MIFMLTTFLCIIGFAILYFTISTTHAWALVLLPNLENAIRGGEEYVAH